MAYAFEADKWRLAKRIALSAIAISCGVGIIVGAKYTGIQGAFSGGLIGLVAGFMFGYMVNLFATFWLLGLYRRVSDEELWHDVAAPEWTASNTKAILNLAARGCDVRTELPRVLKLLGSEDELTRRYGYDVLSLIFDEEHKMIPDYDPLASTETCQQLVADLRDALAKQEQRTEEELHG